MNDMKRQDVIRLLEKHGLHFLREGSNHSLYYKDGLPRPVPVKRHRIIPGDEVQDILKEAGIR